ncbi:MAG: glycosyltransferase family 4 protein [Candidatus Methanoperedens sp.]|nr:glycosyltransferase family 4 protein [Candidatus Methanoperedens sp.]
MDLIYLFPKRDDAPARVGKSILKTMAKYRTELPFNNIKIIIEDRKVDFHDENFMQFENISFFDLIYHKKYFIVHIPISPSFFPNKKFLIVLLCLMRKIPLILHYHGDIRSHIVTQIKYERKIDVLSIPTALFIPFILKKATRVITHSYLLGNILKIDYGIRNCYVIPNGIDDYWFDPLKNNDLYDVGNIIDKINFNLFYHGRLSPEKGVDMLIKAVERYKKINPKTILFIAGEGSQEKDLRKLCSNLNLEKNVIFLGLIGKETIKYFLKNVDAAIYPSRFDAFCLAAMEALASAECPVYISEKAGIYDFIIQNKSKINLFEPNIEKIVEILTHSTKNNENIIANQRDFVKKYTWDKIINQYISFYNNLYTNIK